MNLKLETVTGEPVNAIEKVSEQVNFGAGTYRLTYKMFFDPSDAGGGDWDVYTVQETINVPVALRSEVVDYLKDLWTARKDHAEYLVSDETTIDEVIATVAELTT